MTTKHRRVSVLLTNEEMERVERIRETTKETKSNVVRRLKLPALKKTYGGGRSKKNGEKNTGDDKMDQARLGGKTDQ